jgi:hypothetical protein
VTQSKYGCLPVIKSGWAIACVPGLRRRISPSALFDLLQIYTFKDVTAREHLASTVASIPKENSAKSVESHFDQMSAFVNWFGSGQAFA